MRRGFEQTWSRRAAKGRGDTDDRAPLEVRRPWARLIRKVYQVDHFVCPSCGGRMLGVVVIEPAYAPLWSGADRRPAVVRQILEHLRLPTAAPRLRASLYLPDGLPTDPLGGRC